MKRTFLAVIVTAACMASLASPASAEWYVRGTAGVTTQTEVEGYALPDDGTFGLYAGTAIGPVRVEAGAQRISANMDPVQANAIDLNATAYLDFPITSQTGVYVGAGPDLARASAEVYGYNYETDWSLGYHGEVGVAHRISDSVIVDAHYRYTSVDFDDFDGEVSQVGVGVRFRI